MRLASTLLAFALFSLPAVAWEFTSGTPCVLTHETADAAIRLTYDPSVPTYTIALSRSVAFKPGPVFSMQFNGPLPLGISTDQHQLSQGNKTLTVTDSGFGNVLNGMQFNQSFTATLGEQGITVPLDGASDKVAAFRACDVSPAV